MERRRVHRLMKTVTHVQKSAVLNVLRGELHGCHRVVNVVFFSHYQTDPRATAERPTNQRDLTCL